MSIALAGATRHMSNYVEMRRGKDIKG